ncbi:MAG: endolytic transglycosylase MltG [Microscillaceae bacterium]|nr:endolytic transglycosylase MltG [Microscillaceae bacterium]MDW8459940.1 endolytic transglycosylase MltG [Cytophagales bacterium]
MHIKSKGLILITVLSFTIISISFYVYQILRTANFQIGKPDIYFYIPTGAKFKQVLDSLKKKRIVHDEVSFAFLSKLLNYQDNVKPGRYLIRRNANNWEVVQMLRKGLQTPINISFHNIRLKKDLIKAIAKELEFSEQELANILKDNTKLAKYGFDSTTVMAMFLPNTYQVYWNISAQSFVDRMYKEYQNFWTKERRQKAQELGLTPIQVSILASIVQAETTKEDEKPRIAGVYINRLRKNMRLEADPTVVFAHQNFNLKRVLKSHLEIDSPFNTYRYPGLPPAPINLPTTRSIEAVLNYEKHNYMFFCAKDDFSGYHNFAVTSAEHNRNAQLYHRALALRGIR